MRIFIYSRKSKWTGRGESVENQLAMCRDYIQYNIEGSGSAEIIEYEDEGYSGKNTNRPQFQKMMQEIKKGSCDYLVCYKLDRLGRNIADLANLIETLNKLHVSFISIKERFDTSTPIGKAMLYFAGVLAQMEREQIAERVRDNMLLLARSGRWLGGNTPLGYESRKSERDTPEGKKKTCCYLTENPKEIELVKFIYAYFMEKQSLTKVVEYLLQHRIQTRNGRDFYIAGVRDILTNPVYCQADREAYAYFYHLGCQICIEEEELDQETGLMSYGKTSSGIYKNKPVDYEGWIISRGRHKGIVTGREYVKVQELLLGNREKGEGFRSSSNNAALLTGLVRCTCGHLMRPKNYPASRVNERGERTFAYLCPYKERTHGEGCKTRNVHGNTLDEAVCREVFKLATWSEGVISLLETLGRKIKRTNGKLLTEQDLLKGAYEKKREEIGHLIDAIKKDGGDGVSMQYIQEEIERLDRECRELQEKLEREKELGQREERGKQLEARGKEFSDFSKFFQMLTIQEKREYMRSVLEQVVWDGKTAQICFRSHTIPLPQPLGPTMAKNLPSSREKEMSDRARVSPFTS